MTGYQQMQVVTYLHSRFHKGVSGGPLAKPTDLESAFDKALTQVERSISRLETLERDLKRERAKVGRGIVEWVPDADLTLVAALGRIARA